MKTISFLPFLFTLLFTANLFSQSNIQQSLSVNSAGTTADASSQLDVSATDKGMLVPRMTTAQRTAIASPAAGLLVFDIDTGSFWFYFGGAWTNLSALKTLADADGDTKIQVEKSPDEDIIRFDLGGTENMVLRKNVGGSPRLELPNALNNTFLGENAGASNSTGNSNTANGSLALVNNTTGSTNTATGFQALLSNTTGSTNTATGFQALLSNTTGYNTAIGHQALRNNTTGTDNTANGRVALYSNITGIRNTANGASALYFNTTGSFNTANGWAALDLNVSGSYNTAVGASALYSNTDSYNTAVGAGALQSNTAGSSNTATGRLALHLNTTGVSNTALGVEALISNTTGNLNTATGKSTLFSNTTGSFNTANGWDALFSNTTGDDNTANGASALYSNTTGNYNTASGASALYSNTTGNYNTASGTEALRDNTTGDDNTATGYQALHNNTTGYQNNATGRNTLINNTIGTNNTANGFSAGSINDNSFYCTFIGNDADQSITTLTNNSMALGNDSRITASNQVRIGNSSISSIGGYAPWTDVSDRRFKRNLQEDVPGLGFILQLRPVTYNLDVQGLAAHLQEDRIGEGEKENSGALQKPSGLTLQSREAKSQIRRTGFVAQEVEAAAKSIGYDFSGVDKPQGGEGLYGLRYSEFVMPLVKSVQELQQEIETGKSEILASKLEIEQLKEENAALKAQLEAERTANAARFEKITVALAGAGIAVEK